MKLYQNANGIYTIGDSLVSPGKVILRWYGNATIAVFYSIKYLKIIGQACEITKITREDGSTYDTLEALISENTSLFVKSGGDILSDYYQWLKLGEPIDFFDYGTGGNDGALISGSIPGKDLVFNWTNGDPLLTDLANLYNIPNPVITYAELNNINTNLIPRDKFTIDNNFPTRDIPNLTGAVCYFDGSVDFANGLLLDKISGYNATLSDVDFTIEQCRLGIPFASEASVTFHASTPILGGQTMQLRLLYQNYDLLNQVFCKHEDRVVDGDVLTTPARVIDITVYEAPLIEAELTEALTFFSVPILVADTILSEGDDLTAAIGSANDGDVIVLKEGAYIADNYFLVNKSVSIIGVGNVILGGSNGSRYLYCTRPDTTIEGVRIDAVGNGSIETTPTSTNFTINRVVSTTTGSRGIYLDTYTVINRSSSVGITFSAVTSVDTGSVDIFDSVMRSVYCVNLYNGGEVSYCRLKNQGTTSGYDFRIYNDGAYIFKNNIHNGDDHVIVYNEFSQLSSVTVINAIANNPNNTKIGFDFNNPCKAIEIRDSYVTTSGKLIAAKADSEAVNVKINNNTLIRTLVAGGYIVDIGTELSTANDDLITSEVTGNKVIGINASATDDTHSIFVGHNANFNVSNNLVIDSGYGIVLKHTGVACTGLGCFGNILYSNQLNLRLKGVDNLMVVNNTIDGKAGTALNIVQSDNDGSGSSVGTIFKNNIVTGDGNVNFNDLTGLDSNNNILDVPSINGDSFSEWQGLGYDSNSLDVDPKLSDPVNGEYWPLLPFEIGQYLGVSYENILTSETLFPDIVLVNNTNLAIGAMIFTKNPAVPLNYYKIKDMASIKPEVLVKKYLTNVNGEHVLNVNEEKIEIQ